MIFALALKWYPASLSSLGPFCTPANESVTDRGDWKHLEANTIQRRISRVYALDVCCCHGATALFVVGILENDTEGRTERALVALFSTQLHAVADAPRLLFWCGLSPVTPPTMTSKGIRYQTRWEWSIKYEIFYIITFFNPTRSCAYLSKLSTVHLPHTYLWTLLVRKTNYPVGCSFSFAFYTVINSRTSEREGYSNVKLFIGVSNQRSCRGVGGG